MHYNVDARAAPSNTVTLLPLRHYGCARDISAALTAPVVEYRQPQWTTPPGRPLWTLSPVPNPTAAATGVEHRNGGNRSGTPHAYCIPSRCPAAFTAARTLSYFGGAAASAARATQATPRSSSNVMRAPFTSSYMEALPQRDYEATGRRVRGERAGGATATAGRHSTGSSPPPRSTTSDRQSHRSRDIAQVRPGCTTSTERIRYRNGVTRKLIDLYDEVAELYDCRENMRNQVKQAMRTDPRYSKERHGEVRLAGEPTPQQQSAVESVEDALEVLHDAVHELVAAYLTPEEKRYLGIDTHLFQTNTEKANTYQYAPPPPKPQSSPRSAARRAGGKTSRAAKSPLRSTRHREVREEEEEEGEAHEDIAATAPTPAAPTRTAPADTPAPPQQPLTTTTTHNNISNNVWDSPAPTASAAFRSAAIFPPASPVKLAQQSVAELSPLLASPQPVTSSSQPFYSSIVHVAAPETHEDSFGATAEQRPVAASHTEDTEIAEGTPERVLASAASASTLSSAWPTDTGAGSPPHPPPGSQPPLATDPLVKASARSSPDEQNTIARTPPAIPPRCTSVQAQVPALTSANSTEPPSHPPSQAAAATSCNDASAAQASEPKAQTAVSKFKRFLIDSDSNSSF